MSAVGNDSGRKLSCPMIDASVESTTLCQFLERVKAVPVLVDVGASGAVHEAWLPFAKQSVFVGFDPDNRDIAPDLGAHFREHHIVDKIVAGPENAGTVDFHLTAFPHCSSMLRPNDAVLQSYLFADLFKVERTVQIETVTLAQAMDQVSISIIDWLKIDAQGCDLSVLNGLDDARRRQVLCIEIEPGFLQFYEGEQTFPDLHAVLIKEGFWLAHLKCQQFPRVRADTVERAFGIRVKATDPAAKVFGVSPTAGEARYFRTLEHLRTSMPSLRAYVLAWVFAVSAGQWGFALDVAVDARTLFGDNLETGFMYQSTVTTIASLAGGGTQRRE
ncbi:MAG: FkbM family methyltransferase [Rhodospirillaceae bacterium]|nr:MAG: FkbM family methyltransferase [Rhodospirillaceae bacterium]